MGAKVKPSPPEVLAREITLGKSGTKITISEPKLVIYRDAGANPRDRVKYENDLKIDLTVTFRPDHTPFTEESFVVPRNGRTPFWKPNLDDGVYVYDVTGAGLDGDSGDIDIRTSPTEPPL